MNTRPTVALNASILRAPRTGIGHYVAELASALQAQQLVCPELFTGLAWQRTLPAAAMPGYSQLSRLVKRVVPDAYRVRRVVEQARFNQGVRRIRPALYHEPSLWAFEFDGPMVMTLHDLTHVHYPHTQPRDRLAAIEQHAGQSVLRAQRILVDSQFIAGEVCKHYGVPAQRVVVAPLGHAARFHPRSAAQLTPRLAALGLQPGKYLLCVGTLEPRKNLQLALHAHERLPAALRARYPLVLAGMAGWKSQQLAEPLQRAIAGGQVRLLGYQSDESLAQLFAGARLLLFPSLYEGFGLPVLEAMASGTPVIATQASALPEVAGEAGHYIDPCDDSGCAAAMTQLIEDHSHWQRLREAGLARAQIYTWQRCAQITAGAYHEALAS
jgi:alpha-1,3-rhamnosyl/mannosyltransferase